VRTPLGPAGILGTVVLALTVACGRPADDQPGIVLARGAVDSMNAAFDRSNQHWNELADLNTLERMLGTVRPTQREFLGCLQGEVKGRVVRVDGWVPARNMKRLQLAVAGNCDSVPRLVGTWHTHPYRADLHNLPIKERRLSPQDLETFRASGLAATLVVWDRDSMDGALHFADDSLLHPARLTTR
jgi:proteasome lid subunit RPN8/RPN11